MTWPTTDASTINLDASTDNPSLARADILLAVQNGNSIKNHVSAFAQTVLDDADATTARATLGTPSTSVATGAVNGLMSATDKAKLDGVAPNANNYIHPNHAGDITSVGDGTTTISAKAVTYAKIQDISATDKLLGRATAGIGPVEEITCSAFARTLLDDADAGIARTTLGVGTLGTQNSGAVSITGGAIAGITDLAILDGGTGASDAATARTNLGAAKSGVNADITQTTGLGTITTTTLFVGTADAIGNAIELGFGATGDRLTLIDMTRDTIFPDFGMRFSTSSSSTEVAHRGATSLRLNAVEAGSIVFLTTAFIQHTLDAIGRYMTGGLSTPAAGYTAAGDITLPVAGVIRANNTAKAWAKVTVTGGVPALTDGFNVTSVTDTGVGIVTLNYTNALGGNTIVLATPVDSSAVPRFCAVTNALTTSTQVRCFVDTGTAADPEQWHIMVMGD